MYNYTAFADGLYDYDNYSNLMYGTVVSIEDNTGMGRIRVKIKGSPSVGGDDNIDIKDIEQIPYAYPMLPKHLSAIPKKGEVVWVFVLGKNREQVDRLYIGPIISQLDKLNGDKFEDGGSPLRAFSFGPKDPSRAVTNRDTTSTIIPDLVGVFPKADEISIQGRYNTDVTQKYNEIVIRAGKFEPATSNEFKIKFNASTQAFIQIKNDVTYQSATNKDETEKGTVTNIVANKINLFTHKDGAPRITLNQENLISDEELKRMMEESHQLPFGDVLLDYLKLLKDAIFNHVHNGNGNPATDLSASGNIQAVAALKAKAEDLENKMLSKNIRIN